MELELIWKGPLAWNDLQQSLENRAGVYIWTVSTSSANTYLPSYIGEASRVRERLRKSIIDLLGGGSWIWSIDDLRIGKLGNALYQPDTSADAFFSRSIEDLHSGFESAMQSLNEYRFFVAYDARLENTDVRRAAETELIKGTETEDIHIGSDLNLGGKRCLQNSRIWSPKTSVNVLSRFENGVKVLGIRSD